jgi:hypothetical protein
MFGFIQNTEAWKGIIIISNSEIPTESAMPPLHTSSLASNTLQNSGIQGSKARESPPSDSIRFYLHSQSCFCVSR